MTNEEAIKILDDITSYCDFTDEYGDMINSTPYFEALDMAIKALEQQPILDTRQRERQLEMEYQHGYDKGWEEGRKALDQQPCEDCISREAVRRILANQRDELVKLHTVNPKDNPKADAMAYGVNWSLNTLMELPSVIPKAESEEIE